MNSNWKIGIVISFLTLSLLPFTNCGQYAEPASEAMSSTGFVPCNDRCITPVLENLSVKVNMGTATSYTVTNDLAEFNLGGDCNEGGYVTNFIRWELQLNGSTVRHSGMSGMSAGGTADSKCVNGRFMVYVFLGSIAADPVDRRGLKTSSGAKSTYDLVIEIYGQDMPGDPAPKRNMTKGRTKVLLSTS